MIRLVLAQMSRSRARLVAAGLAITISTAFVATALLVTNALNTIAHDTVSARFAQADLVIEPIEEPIDDATIHTVVSQPGVQAADAQPDVWQRLDAGSESTYVRATSASPNAQLQPYQLVRGALPLYAGSVALTQSTADRLGVDVGSRLTAVVDGSADPGGPGKDIELTVTGIVHSPQGVFDSADPALLAPAGLAQLRPGAEISSYEALVLLDPSASPHEAAAQITEALQGRFQVQTVAQAVEQRINDFLGSAMLFIALIFGFGAIALLVAALVISNTFQVLIAQRTHQLALLRCVGATRAQIRRSVLAEATLMGSIASVAGLALGIALAQAALWGAGAATLEVPVPKWVDISVWVIVVPLVCGVATTAIAALVPARAATRVAPLAALRPEQLGAAGSRGSGARIGWAMALLVGGLAMLGAVIVASLRMASVNFAFLAMCGGIVAGTLVVIGVVLSAIRWLPPLVARLTEWAMGRSAVGRLTAANLRRNPRRTAATATALVIGVGLVAMMSTGAASARVTLGRTLDERNPVDIVVGTTEQTLVATPSGQGGPDGTDSDTRARIAPLSSATVQAVGQVRGVTASAQVKAASGVLEGPHGLVPIILTSADPAAVAPVGRIDQIWQSMHVGGIEITPGTAAMLGTQEGGSIQARVGSHTSTFTVHIISGPETRVISGARITDQDMALLAPQAPVAELWLRISDNRMASDVSNDIISALSSSDDTSAPVQAAASSRQGYQRVITTMLSVVLALLGASVVIALIGVANTLSLSVIERRRESAILRAVGLKRSGLRATLAAEGTAIALAGTLTGLVLGVGMGWAGTTVMLAGTETVQLATPWPILAITIVIAIAAGLLSSILPARKATATPPVAALADE